MSKYWDDHVHYLEKLEAGLYDENDHLLEDKLGEEGIFPPDMVKAWTPEVQAKVVHREMQVPSPALRVPANYGRNAHLETPKPAAYAWLGR